MGFFEDWKEVLSKPKEVFAKRKKDASLVAAVKTYVILGAIAGFVTGISIAILGAAFSTLPGMGSIATFGLIAIPFLIIGGAILYPVSSLIISVIFFLFAKVLGGRGDFTPHFYLPSLYAIPMFIVHTGLSIIPYVGSFIAIVLQAYYFTLALKEVHGLSTMRAVGVWLLPLIVVILLGLLLFGSILALAAGAASAR